MASLSFAKEGESSAGSVNQVGGKGDRKPQHRQSASPKGTSNKKMGKNNACYRCGNTGHFGRDPTCPAKGKICNKCGGKDHFSTVCKTKPQKGKGRLNYVDEGHLEKL